MGFSPKPMMGGMIHDASRQREYDIREGMNLPQRFDRPSGSYTWSGDAPSVEEYKASGENISGYMERTRNPLIKGMDLDYGEAPTTSVTPKGSPYTPPEQGYSSMLRQRIMDAERRTLSSYRKDNPDMAQLDIYEIGAESINRGTPSIKRPYLGKPNRGLEMNQPIMADQPKTLLGA